VHTPIMDANEHTSTVQRPTSHNNFDIRIPHCSSKIQ
jgi:hypothetical protein